MPSSPNRERLAELMEERRKDLRLRWQDVAETAGLSLKTLHSVRTSDKGMAQLTKTAIEDALRWEHGSVDLILAGGDPVPSAAEPDSLFEWTPAGAGYLSPEEQAEITPLAMEILEALVHAKDAGLDRARVTGSQLFPGRPEYGLAWDVARQNSPWQMAVWSAAKGIFGWERDVAARRQGRQGSAGA